MYVVDLIEDRLVRIQKLSPTISLNEKYAVDKFTMLCATHRHFNLVKKKMDFSSISPHSPFVS